MQIVTPLRIRMNTGIFSVGFKALASVPGGQRGHA